MATKTEKQQTGKLGEDIAVRFLVKRGFKVVERNYLKKFGEIDIVCRKNKKLHFIEVKTVSRETLPQSVSRETHDEYRPEDNVDERKLTRIRRTIEVYLNEKDTKEDWEFHVLGIVLDNVRKTANVRFLQDIII